MKQGWFVSCGAILIGLWCGGCEEKTGSVGDSTRPFEESLVVFADTFDVELNTIKMQRMYSRAPYGVLGAIDNFDFGNIQSDYLAQFYLPSNFYFHENIIITDENKDYNGVDSVALRLYFSGYTGDPNVEMSVSIYDCNKKAFSESDRYTDVNPADFCDMTADNLLGSGKYVIPQNNDSLKFVEVKMKRDLAKQILNKELPESQRVPQIYITNTGTKGLLLNVSYTDLIFYFKYTNEGGNSVVGTRTVSVTKEVLQLNHVVNSATIPAEDNYAYLHSPAGLYTQIVFPKNCIEKLLNASSINSVNVVLPFVSSQEANYKANAPEHILLLPAKEVETFFEKNTTYDLETSFVAYINTEKQEYHFYNISSYFVHFQKTDPGNTTGWDTVAIVPIVNVKSNLGIVTQINSQVYPTSVKLIKGTKQGRVSVIYANYPK